MHVFSVAFAVAGACYAIFEQQSLIVYFSLVVAAYVAISMFYPRAKDISIRKKIMLATWTDPSEGVIIVKAPVRVEKCQQIISKCPPGQKLTLTHFALKAVGELMNEAQDINGKLVFGKFVPYKTTDISCLIDIGGGKDLAMVLIHDIANMSINDIAAFIRSKGTKIKQGKGDAEHKKRTGPAKMLPAFIVSILIEFSTFITSKLGISLPALGLKKDQFGSAVVTSLGMLNFQDATAPFSGFANAVVFASICAVTESPVVEDGKIVVGRQMMCNFAVDHRYVDGGRAKSFVSAFRRVFENPQDYLTKSGRSKVEDKKQK